MQPPLRPLDTRQYFLDWVRILAFFVLIAYHVGMYYVSWDWHVKSPFASAAPEPFMLMSAPWRLTLLFFVAGAASRFMLGRVSIGGFVRRRSLRLLLPLVFGMLVIVPPQPYLEVVEKLGYGDGYGAFLRLYYSAYGGFCREDCLDLPTWNHLWFVAYLWVYTLVLALLVALLPPARLERLAERGAQLVQGWKLIVLPAAVLALVRILLVERFPSTHGLVDDWYNHAAYLPPFLLGALMAKHARFWEQLEAQRWLALALALCAWTGIVIWQHAPHDQLDPAVMAVLRPLTRSTWALCAWSAIVSACGFARRHLNLDGPARRYLTEAVFPVYIAHQTLIVVLAHALKPLRIAPGLEALLLIVLTAGGCFALFELVRRSALLRPLFGLSVSPGVPAAPLPLPGRPAAVAVQPGPR